jgi:hypothetical protein
MSDHLAKVLFCPACEGVQAFGSGRPVLNNVARSAKTTTSFLTFCLEKGYFQKVFRFFLDGNGFVPDGGVEHGLPLLGCIDSPSWIRSFCLPATEYRHN